jgi:outer membrane protein, multidrug efflux system
MKYGRNLFLGFLATLPVFFAGCMSGPDYKKPDAAELAPADWRWKIAEPCDALPKGDWWHAYGDATLDKLERDALTENQSLKAAVARVAEARATARISRSQLYPSLTGNGAYQHQRLSGNRPMQVSTPMAIEPMETDSHSVSLDMVYEVDLWGRVSRSNEASQAQFAASAADYNNALLTLTADVAIDYFSLRAKDAEIATLRRAVTLREESARILKDRAANGLIPEIDLSQAETELAQTKADLAETLRQKAELFNALALLCGKAPAELELAENAAPLAANPITVPAKLPSALLERRPDVAAAERNLAAKNAQIGVARAAYFPSVTLVGSGGFLSTDASTLFTNDSAVWSIAPKVSLPLFTAGKTKADVERATAAYDEALANYRQAVLVAFKDVEDSLAGIRFLAEQDAAQNEAVAFARKTADLAEARYKAGYVDYMTVANAERNYLAQERQAAKLRAQRYAASIKLVKAMGGGFATAK